MSIAKYAFVPEGFTQNDNGEVLQGANERRKKVAGVFYDQTKSIKRPKKNAAQKVRKKDVAVEKNRYDGLQESRKNETMQWEQMNKDLYNNNKAPLTFRQFENKQNRKQLRRK
jgi:hypothetical protein